MDEGLLKPGAVLNNTYRIEELVGEGGTGEVYRAINTASRRTVAIKILKSQFSQDPKFLDLMRRELLHNVSDDAVVRYYDLLRTAEDHGGLYFLVMDFIDGPSLADLMEKGPVSVDLLMDLAKRVTQGLAACHSASIYHRDISPDNIILRDGDPRQATLIDFGIAKDVRPDAKTVVGGGFAGKYEYAAPEQLDGLSDGRSDIYSFGMTLLAATRGESPKLGTSFLEIVKAKHAPVDTEGVAEPLRSLVDAMVHPSPDDRPQSAEALLSMIGANPNQPGIESLLAPEDSPKKKATQESPQTVIRGVHEERKKKGKGGLVAAFLALGVIGGGAYYALGPGKQVVSDLIGGVGLAEAKPYMMRIASNSGKVSVEGNAPSATAASSLATALEEQLDIAEGDTKLTAASGAPNENWQSTITLMAAQLAKLSDGELIFRDDQITLVGTAASDDLIAEIKNSSRKIAGDGQFRIALTLEEQVPAVLPPATPPVTTPTDPIVPEPDPSATPSETAPSSVDDDVVIAVPADDVPIPAEPTPGPSPDRPTPPVPADVVAPLPPATPVPPGIARPSPSNGELTSDNPDVAIATPASPPPPALAKEVVSQLLESVADCGPLSTSGSGAGGFATGATIRIRGDVASADAIGRIQQSVSEIAEGRTVNTDRISVLNPSVCLVKNALPDRTSGAASLLYYSAKTGAVVAGDALKPDDQAVVYFSAPDDLDGYLHVFLADNEFNTIHLRPMQARPENKLSLIGSVEDGRRRIQLTWPLPEGSGKQPVLAFSEPYGISMIFIVVTRTKKLFPEIRSLVEGTRDFLPALERAIKDAEEENQIVSHIQRLILVDEQ